MAVLTDQERQDTRHLISKYFSRLREDLELTKEELKAAVDATDQWIEDNQANFNAALPLPARTNLTAKQKVLLFFYVANKRYEVI